MFRSDRKTILTVTAALLSVLSAAVFGNSSRVPESSGYECAFAISNGKQSIRQVQLTHDVYRCFQFDNYTDIGVLNEGQQLVPFRLVTPTKNIARKRDTRRLSFYQEPLAPSYRSGEQIRRIAALTGVVSERIDDQQWLKTNVHYSSVILEQSKNNSQQDEKLISIWLGVKTSDTPVRATVLIEESNDLQNWRSQSEPHEFFFLPGNDKNLNSNTLTLSDYDTIGGKSTSG